jgi:hypothetical protein
VWGYCNYDDRGVGYPRDCGKTGYVDSLWFAMPTSSRFVVLNARTPGSSLALYTGAQCPSPLSAIWTKHENLYCDSYGYKNGGNWFSRPMLMLHCSDAPTIQAVPVSASGTAVPDNTATAAKRAGGCATTELGVELGKSPINEPSAPRASTPPETLAIGRRGVSPPAPGADMPEPPDPRCAIEIRVRLFGFCTVLLHTLLL